MSTGRKVAYNTVVQLIGKVVTTVASLGIVYVITRQLGIASYGDYTTVIAYTQLFSVFADLGVNVFLIKQLSAHPEREEEEVATAFGLRLVSGAAVLAVGYLLTLVLPYSPIVRTAIALGMVAIFAQNVNSLFVSILQARLQMIYSVITDVAGRFLVLGLTWYFVRTGHGLLSVVGAVAAGGIVNVLLTYIFTSRLLRVRLNWDTKAWRAILRAAIPISITAILSFIYFKIDTVMLSTLHIPGKSNSVEVGIYGGAYRILDLLMLVPAIFIGNIFPIISRYVATADARLEALLGRTFTAMAAASFPITVTVFMLAPKIIQLIAGPSFAPAAVPLRILCFAVLTSYFTGIFTYTVLALNRQRSLVTVYTLAALLNIGLNWFLIPRYSYFGAAYVTLITEVIVLVGSFSICYRRLKFIPPVVSMLKMLGVAGVFLLVMISFPHLSLFWMLLILAGLYVPLLVLFNVMKPGDLRSLLRPPEGVDVLPHEEPAQML